MYPLVSPPTPARTVEPIREDWEERFCVDAISYIEIVEANGFKAKVGQRKTMVVGRVTTGVCGEGEEKIADLQGR